MYRSVRCAVMLACLVVTAASASAQSAVDPVDEALATFTNALPTPPIAFVGITPCRLVDTRGGPSFPPGSFGPPSLVGQPPGGAFRFFPVAGNCGIPLTAQAVSANMAVTNTSGTGFISVWPGGDPQPSPLVASLNFSAGQTIANAVLAPLGNGGINVFARVTTDLIIDVNGYFDTGAAGPPGATGATGAPGAPGAPGATGAQGSQGLTGPQGPGAIKLNVALNNGESQDLAAGGFTIRLICGGTPNFRTFALDAADNGVGTIAGVKAIDDTPGSTIPYTVGFALQSGGTRLATIGFAAPNPGGTNTHFYRLAGTLVLGNASVVTTVVYAMFLDDRSNTGLCTFRATAVPSF